MPSPKNPLDGGGSMQGQPNMTIAPKVPPYDGGQFAGDAMTPEEIAIRRDQYFNEIPTDRPYHTDSTPGHSNPTYVGRQYDTIVTSPMGNQYGTSVTDMGQSPSKSQVSVNPNSADRGKES
jgi:hypothetical protein